MPWVFKRGFTVVVFGFDETADLVSISELFGIFDWRDGILPRPFRPDLTPWRMLALNFVKFVFFFVDLVDWFILIRTALI